MTFRFGARGAVLGGTACAVLLAGCADTGYFRVRDPGAQTSYYTTKIKTDRAAVKFKDEQSGDRITLQSSEVKKISKPEFMKGATTPLPAPAAAAPAPVPTVGAQLPATPAAAGASAPPAKLQ